ncbi:MAG: hypothetical protein M5R40_06910 [Anaerolineae bacterium]|nr:hypothetical protein [Anaerolineae bacterium]
MLQVIREYAMEQLAESGEVVVVNDRHAAFFLELAERAEPHLTSGRRGVWLARLGMELDNLRAVLRRSLDGQISPRDRAAVGKHILVVLVPERTDY